MRSHLQWSGLSSARMTRICSTVYCVVRLPQHSGCHSLLSSPKVSICQSSWRHRIATAPFLIVRLQYMQTASSAARHSSLNEDLSMAPMSHG